jgi:V8-like Glu-specific endopeptidase
MKELDIPTLVQVINDCFENSRNNQAFNEEQRSQWFIKGSEYKQLLVRAVGKKMTEELDPKVRDANQRLSEISERLKDVQKTLKNYNKTIQDLTTLAEIIGQIIDLASLVLPLRSMMSNPTPFASEFARESFSLDLLKPTEGSTGSDPVEPFFSASKLLVKGRGTVLEFLAIPTGSRNIIPAYASSQSAAGFNPPSLPFESILGRDDRVRIPDTYNTPWRMICSLSIQGPRGSFQGTGWFAGPKTIITAGHCIYQESQMGGWATQIQVSPGQDGNNFPYSSVVSKKFEVPEEWVASRGTNPDFDYGVIFLDESLGERTGWFSVAITDNNKLDGASVNLSGYPGDAAGGFGIYQLFHADQVSSSPGDSRFYYSIDTYGGQSGAPVWIELDDNGNRQVVGIHTYGIGGSFKLNSATRITPTILTDIKQWLNK